MAWLGITRALGDFGSQVGQGYDISQQWKQRQQQMAMENARQKLAAITLPLQLQKLQRELQQSGVPQYEGIVPTEGGGQGSVMYDPNKGTTSVQALPGTAAKQKKYTDIKIGKDGKPYGLNEQTGQYDLLGSPEGSQFVVPGSASAGKLIRGDYVPDKNSATGYSRQMMDAQGNVVKLVKDVIPPGTIPKETEGFAITQDEDGNVIMVPKTTVTRPARPGATATSGGTPQEGGGPGKVIGHKDTAIQRDAVKSSAQARDAFTNYSEGLRNSQTNNPRTNIALVIAAAKSTIAGGGGRLNSAEIEQQLKAGSLPDKVERWYQMATSGTLPDDQRQQIVDLLKNDYESKRATAEQDWKYSYPGKPLPPWLRPQAPEMTKGATDPASQLPPNYVLDKKH